MRRVFGRARPRTAADGAAPPAQSAPFAFEVQDRDLVDRVNGLRVRCYQWPEYEFSVTVEPLKGEQAQAWPVSERAYYEFGYAWPVKGKGGTCTFGMAVARQPFGRDYPGRAEDLLDTVIPLIIPMHLTTFPSRDPDMHGVVPDKMRALLRERGSYYRHRDEPGTDEYQQANPGLYPERYPYIERR